MTDASSPAGRGGRIAVLMETEGTYPFEGGGVSTWCDILVRELPEVDFTVLAVTGSPNVAFKYQPPDNVRAVRMLPLWGAADPSEYLRPDADFGVVFSQKLATTDDAVRRHFLPLFTRFLGHLADPHGPAPDALGLVHAMYRYFLQYDYKETFRAPCVWDAFKRAALAPYRAGGRPEAESPTVFDLTTAMRWLHNFLMPLAYPLPDADLAHATIAGFSGLAAVVAKAEHGMPLVVTDHGIFARERYIAISQEDFSFYAKTFLLALSTFVTRLCYHAADQVSPVCDYNRRWEERLGTDPAKIRTIYNGISPDVFVPARKPERTTGRPTVVAAARIFRLKDIETMIRSCAVARREVPDVHYLVYGSTDADPPYTEMCRALVGELGLEDHFELAGFHSRPAELYNEGDINVLSSISEGFPFTVIESMSCARPVVATDVGGVREALEGCGIVVRPRDAEALGQGVARLLKDGALRGQLGRLSRERVLLKFRTATSVDAYRESYERLAADRRAALGAPDARFEVDRIVTPEPAEASSDTRG